MLDFSRYDGRIQEVGEAGTSVQGGFFNFSPLNLSKSQA